MQSFIVFACALAVASAGHLVSPVTYYAGPQHLPVINHEGVPVDTAEVQHATAAHLAHKANAHARNGDLAVAVHSPVFAGAYADPHYHHAYPTTAVAPVAVNGVPLETPEVVAAKAYHFAAHAEALARYRRGIYAYSVPVVAHHGPVVAHHTPAVASAYPHTYAHPYAYAANYY